MTHPAEGKLLPCPFCGAQPTTDRAGVPGKFGPIPTVRCTNEECFGPHTTAQFLADAVKQWNTRHSQGGSASDDWCVEVWNGDKKVTIYRDNVLRVWGPSMDDQMTDEPRNLETVNAAFQWLFAATTPSPAESVVKPTDANISVLAEALYHCGCPAGGMTVGECAEQGVCGCSIRAERIKGCMGPDHQYFSREGHDPDAGLPTAADVRGIPLIDGKQGGLTLALPPLQLPLDGLPDQVKPGLAVRQIGVDALQHIRR